MIMTSQYTKRAIGKKWRRQQVRLTPADITFQPEKGLESNREIGGRSVDGKVFRTGEILAAKPEMVEKK